MASKVETSSGRRLRRQDRRARILDAATDAFARTGFAATSLDDIATDAGVSRVIRYRHFGRTRASTVHSYVIGDHLDCPKVITPIAVS